MALTDFFLIVVVLIVLVIMSVPIWSVMSTILPGLRDSSGMGAAPGETPTTSDQAFNQARQLIRNFDTVFLMVALGFGLAIVISSFFIESHPAFFFVSLILGAIALTITPVFANFYNDYVVGFNNSEFNASVDMPVITFVMQHFPEYMIGIIFMTFIALYAKFKRGSE